MNIDLNCDLGEAYGNYSFGGDQDIIPLITSANIACGFHAGDENVMNRTIQLAKKHQVGIGAHPGLPDLKGFGRRNMDIAPEEIYNIVIYQLGALNGFCRIHDAKMNHVKPHGALYQMGAKDKNIARTITKAVVDFDSELKFVGLANSLLITEAEKMGIKVVSEVFADRRYEDDGQLVSRKDPNATISNTDEAVQQVLKMVIDNKVVSKNGKDIGIQADTICVHGDGSHALEFVTQIRNKLEKEGIDIQSL
ncbi:5-oxoprolinase subunit PxpA [Staphylococcus saccharolyticus]|uniref:5-oxoprolinase subunit PxpA n=1 Tax=Staphylococcus saccharolyticus TaxID=33028 RepID=UPI00102DCE28|nr:5-oxoprolinase subunit PxpA [Staphylococcus saccharolyticus]MBL7573337.1 5-oxoprolinase subunit PxpA [Staphylococcus saccharolyticus]MBL7583728.1 5-oxoprolinase subunit PxpA [Staphylococcus saccharolyticus]MBL7638955.1 5-oxoprolinase subunit PxpA [Staphylococcus saccharolyticus]QRJ67573.1 5-oxoprolinase subunit PxpA [Staphylococcus saccharolyticus]TAA93865.1 LamB/YcsF family protein [Staphylococcus saccharolyticus]